MTRSGCIGLSAGLVLSLFALGCGSSNSEGGKGGNGGNNGTSGPWDQARIGNTGAGWWMNVAKGKFYLTVRLLNAYEDEDRAKTVSIAKMMADKSGSGAESVVLKLNEIPGGGNWINDPDRGETAQGPALASGKKETTDLIDGGADPFYTSSYEAKTLVWANYLEVDASKTDPFKLEMVVWEMGSAADAKAVYSDLLSDSLYKPVTWTTCAGTDANKLCP